MITAPGRGPKATVCPYHRKGLDLSQLLKRLASALLGTDPNAPEPGPAVTLENQINKLINAERARHGCDELTVHPRITAAARSHSRWMAATGRFSHAGKGGSRFVSRVRAAGYSQPSAENIAWGNRTASAVVAGWMKSPGHRANILNRESRTVGVGVVFTANRTPYITQNFGY